MATKSLVGMHREWEFTATLEHKAARIKLNVLPHWIVGNLDADEVALPPDPHRKFTNLKPFLTFRDLTASAKAGDMWEEVEKTVTWYRGRLQVNAPLRDWCKRCIQLVLSDERTVSVNGDTRLQSIAVGEKMLRGSPYKIGGHHAFTFKYQQHDKTAAITETHHVAIGTIVNGCGYLILVSCSREEELDVYLAETLLNDASVTARCELDVDVTYADCPHKTLLQQRDLFGILRYYDRGAAIEFTLPMHAMHIRPDHSPVQSGGSGSLACLTLELEVFQKLYDEDAGDRVATGTHTLHSASDMPRFKGNSVVLYIEVEEITKISDFSPVMSVDTYAKAKIEKLKIPFSDLREVGAPLSRPLGQRTGRATTCTFSYEMELPGTSSGGIGGRPHHRRTTTVPVKALFVATLVGNHGATAVYFTKLGQAIFDSHLYIFQHLLSTLHFYTERDLVAAFSKDDAARVKLTDQDLPVAYKNANAERKPVLLKRHMNALANSTDGEAEAVQVIVVRPPEPDPVPAASAPAADEATADPAAKSALNNEVPAAGEDEEADSVVSVGDIPHLADLEQLALLTPIDGGDISPNSAAGAHNDEAGGEGDDAAAGADAKEDDRTSAVPLSPDDARASPTRLGDGASPKQSPHGSPIAASLDAAADQEPAPAALDEDTVAALVADAMRGGEVPKGQGLCSLYLELCKSEGVPPNSYLRKKLPDDPRFTGGIEEFDMSFNYVGHAGFRAILKLLAAMPMLRSVHFNSMSLDNADVEELCKCLATNRTVRAVHMRNNARVSLPASPHLLRMLRQNRRITACFVSGCSMSSELVNKIEETAAQNRTSAVVAPRSSNPAAAVAAGGSARPAAAAGSSGAVPAVVIESASEPAASAGAEEPLPASPAAIG